jgi:hypothetical protein
MYPLCLFTLYMIVMIVTKSNIIAKFIPPTTSPMSFCFLPQYDDRVGYLEHYYLYTKESRVGYYCSYLIQIKIKFSLALNVIKF